MGNKLGIQKRRLKMSLLLIVLAFIAIFIWKTDLSAVKKEISNIGFRVIYIFACTFFAYLLGTWGWRMCLGADKRKISISQLFIVRQIGETVGLYNPTSIVGGDLFKVELLKRYCVDTQIALNSVLVSRITAILSQVLLFLSMILWLLLSPFGSGISRLFGLWLYAFISVLIIAKIALFIWMGTRKHLETIPVNDTESAYRRLKRYIKMLLFDVKFFFRNDKKAFWYSYFLFFLHWVVGSLEFYLILHFLGYRASVLHGLFLDMYSIAFKSLGAFIPGQLGIEELGNKFALSTIGITSLSLWVTVSLLRRTRQLCWIAIGFILYFFIKKDVRNITTA
ncbi:flippase-like domain-containing protein [Sphingobacterium olei]|uniref:Flippase-like domain-containing protein n=1 Tax=Sphingobacterium olei TaxID=2571155 RepID=A0A4V5MKN0_9SPHI|nr:lysylphosphatidylglycerol synthase transmembrane domain-containing protein [Sphingobacterium olei]TJZ52418.1 flippase-like domain-containing protein [Sphingobacterium olei]